MIVETIAEMYCANSIIIPNVLLAYHNSMMIDLN